MARRYPQQQYTELGKLISRLTHSLAKVQDWSIEETMDYISKRTHLGRDMIYRWQQGRSRPQPDILEILTSIGRYEADLSREWAEDLLRMTHHPDAVNILNKLWGPKEIHAISCKLPRLEHTELVGRQVEIAELLKLLSSRYAVHLITIDGIGGVGKTALILEVAHRCWHASTGEVQDPKLPTFDAIIFVSAKQQYLTPDGILISTQANRTLRDIFREVARTLNFAEISRYTTLQDQLERVLNALAHQNTLLIVDNLETMEDKQEILSFLYQLPPSVKAVITTRERAMFSPIRLEQLAEGAALDLIEKDAQKTGTKVSREQAHSLYQRIGGIPAALSYAVGQLVVGYSLETVLSRVPHASGDVARFCFQGSIEPLRGKPTHLLLMSLAMFPKAPLRVAASYVADLGDPITVEDALAQLQRLSLVSQEEGRYRLLPLTREYALAELAAHKEFEQKARERWVEWYHSFTKEYGGQDEQEWHIRYDRLEEEWENLLAVFDWCATHDRYNDIRSFWRSGRAGSVHEFAEIYGYWDDKLTWQNWLLQAAQGRGDWPIVVEEMVRIAFIYAVVSRYDDAERMFAQAWKLSEYLTPDVWIGLATDNSYLCMCQKRYSHASHLLDLAHAHLPQLEEPLRTQWSINISYDYSCLYFLEQRLDEAKENFQELIKQCEDFGWQRIAVYAQNYLADIAILQERFSEAEPLLQAGLTISERNKEKRRTALYKRSLAYLYSKLENFNESRHWAQEARDGFERLGMLMETSEMVVLLQKL